MSFGEGQVTLSPGEIHEAKFKPITERMMDILKRKQ